MKSSKNTWQGYTLDEIRYRQMLAHVRLDMTTEQLKMYVNQTFNNSQSQQAEALASKFDSLMKWAEYGVLGYRVFRRISALLRNASAE